VCVCVYKYISQEVHKTAKKKLKKITQYLPNIDKITFENSKCALQLGISNII